MDKVSYFVVDNLHCPSCVCTVKCTLYNALKIPPTNVDISLISQTITIRHADSVSTSSIAHSLQEAGFEVKGDEDYQLASSWIPRYFARIKRRRRHLDACKSCQAADDRRVVPETPVSKSVHSTKPTSATPIAVTDELFQPPTYFITQLTISGMSCSSCVSTIHEAFRVNREKGILSCDVDLMTNSARVVHDISRFNQQDIVDVIEGTGYHAEIVQSIHVKHPARVTSDYQALEYRLQFHIGGMTCASCSNSITQGLQQEAYVKSVNVNFTANSGTAIITNKEDAQKIKEEVEAMGYECDLGEIVPLRPLEASPPNSIREVKIRIDGMFCE